MGQEAQVHCDGREAAGLHMVEDRKDSPYLPSVGMDAEGAAYHCWKRKDDTQEEAAHGRRTAYHDLHRTYEAVLGEARGRCLICRSLQVGEPEREVEEFPEQCLILEESSSWRCCQKDPQHFPLSLPTRCHHHHSATSVHHSMHRTPLLFLCTNSYQRAKKLLLSFQSCNEHSICEKGKTS